MLALFLPPSAPPPSRSRTAKGKPHRGATHLRIVRVVSVPLALAVLCTVAWWLTDTTERCNSGKWVDRAEAFLWLRDSRDECRQPQNPLPLGMP